MFKEEIKSLQTLKSKLLLRIQELEEELKATKEEAEKLAKSSKSDDEVSYNLLFCFLLIECFKFDLAKKNTIKVFYIC